MSDGPKVVYIKKKGKHAGHHGGAWKVAYADFVTAMMALFIVLWLLTQTDSASRERIAQYFRTGSLPGGTLVHGHAAGSNPPMAINIFPTAPPPRRKPDEDDQKQLKKMADAIYGLVVEGERNKDKDKKKKEKKAKENPADGIDDEEMAKHVKARLVDEGALIELVDGGDNFLFSVSSSELKAGAIKLLRKIAPMLGSVSNKIEIHGHTDARRFDPKAPVDNWDLSFERANQARQVLEAAGLPKNRISAVLAHADTAPYNPKDPFSPENRRLAILVVRSGHEDVRQGNVGPQFKLPGADAKDAQPESGHTEPEHKDEQKPKEGEAPDERGGKPSAAPARAADAEKPAAGEHPSGEVKPSGARDEQGGEPHGAKDTGDAPSEDEHAAPAEAPKAKHASPIRTSHVKHRGQTVSAKVARQLRADPGADAAKTAGHENSPKKAK